MGIGYKPDQGTGARWLLMLMAVILVIGGSVTIYQLFIPVMKSEVLKDVNVNIEKQPFRLDQVAEINVKGAFSLLVSPSTKKELNYEYDRKAKAIYDSLKEKAASGYKNIQKLSATKENLALLQKEQISDTSAQGDTLAEYTPLSELAEFDVKKENPALVQIIVKDKSETERIFEHLNSTAVRQRLDISSLSRLENMIRVIMPVRFRVDFPRHTKIFGQVYLSGGFIAAVIWCLGLGILFAYFIFFKHQSAEFIISTENELKKVHWPQIDEAKRAVIIVIGTLVFFGVFVLLADFLFRELFMALDILPS